METMELTGIESPFQGGIGRSTHQYLLRRGLQLRKSCRRRDGREAYCQARSGTQKAGSRADFAGPRDERSVDAERSNDLAFVVFRHYEQLY